MKALALIGLLAITSFTVAGDRTMPGPSARYQILNCTLRTPSGHDRPTVIKLDTFTGESWSLEMTEVKDKVDGRTLYITAWSSISDNPLKDGGWLPDEPITTNKPPSKP